jgi:hypothetical protein
LQSAVFEAAEIITGWVVEAEDLEFFRLAGTSLPFNTSLGPLDMFWQFRRIIHLGRKAILVGSLSWCMHGTATQTIRWNVDISPAFNWTSEYRN